MAEPLLRVEGVSRRFGGIQALERVSLAVHPGEVLAVIGPNGAGKTTLFNVVSGLDRPDEGRVVFLGKDVVGKPPQWLAQQGMARTFQNLQVFSRLSVIENVLVPAWQGRQPSLWRALLGWEQHQQFLDQAKRALATVGLAEVASMPASALSFGQQRLLELARALALEPRLLLLDEPLSGLAPEERARLLELVAELRAQGLGVLLIEHDVPAVMRSADAVVVLHQGAKIAAGTPAAVAADPAVQAAYLGEEVAIRRSAPLRQATEPLLEVRDLCVRRGPVPVLHGVSLEVRRGQCVGILGPNGAGKSTLLGSLVGLFPAESGEVRLAGTPVQGRSPERLVRQGLSLVPERRQLFSGLTVRENLLLGAYPHLPLTVLGQAGRFAQEDLQRVLRLFPRLAERQRQLAGTLSGGEQQMLALARGLMGRPQVLLLDEPSLGLAPRVVSEILAALAQLRDEGVTIVLVEQNVRAALAFCDDIYWLERGEIVRQGPPEVFDAALSQR
ncbi:MAG: ATP-binding cassette domain-containing protein [Chloroflexi bacterium]|nr:ATP-binding cassette domain-containing protein [Chloroflexota bacterium]